ncbi:TrbI/VirB10 family protein, partial [Xanthomonas phaseoli]
QITQKNLNIQPTLEIRPGYRFNVMVTKDLVLPPYRVAR